MWELVHKEGRMPKNWCIWTEVLEKILESPLDYKEIKPVNPKGNQLWLFIGRSDAKTEAPIIWAPDAKSQLIRKDPDAGKDWRQEKGTTEDEMVGWHHWLNGHEFMQAPGVGEGQGSLVCCSPWGHKESDTTDWLNWTELELYSLLCASLGGKRTCGRVGTRICMAESLHCSPETTTTLLIGYTPIQNKKFKVWKKF